MGEQAIADPLRSKTFRALHLLASCAHDHLPPAALGGESEGRVRQTPIPSPFSLPDLPVTTSLRPVLRQSMSRNNALPFAGEICMFCPWGTGVNLKLRLLSCLMHLAPAPQYSKRALGYQDWLKWIPIEFWIYRRFSTRNVRGELTRKDKRLLQSE